MWFINRSCRLKTLECARGCSPLYAATALTRTSKPPPLAVRLAKAPPFRRLRAGCACGLHSRPAGAWNGGHDARGEKLIIYEKILPAPCRDSPEAQPGEWCRKIEREGRRQSPPGIPGRKRSLAGFHFWVRGCRISIVGLDEQTIRKYIRNQVEREEREEQLALI